MTLEDYVSWIQSGQTKQAYIGLQKLYEQTKDLNALFYITIIDLELSFKEKREEIGKNFKLIFNAGKKFRLLSYEAYLAYLIDTHSYEDMEKVLGYAKKDNYHTYLSSLARSIFLCAYKNDFSPKLKDAITDALSFQESRNDINNLNLMLIDYYVNNELVDEAKDCLNKFAINHPGNPLINLLGLKISLIEHYPEYDDYYFEEVMDSPFKDRGLITLGEHYFLKKDYLRALDALLKIDINVSNYKDVFVLIIDAFIQSKEYQKGIEYFSKYVELEPFVCLYLGTLYSLKGDNKSLDESLMWFNKGKEIIKMPIIERDIANIAIIKNDLEGLNNSIKALKENDPLDAGGIFYEMCYKIFKGDFEEALKLYHMINDNEYKAHAFNLFPMIGTEKEARKEFVKLVKSNSIDPSSVARAYYYGMHGLKTNKDKVIGLLDDDYESKIYQILIDYEKDKEKGLKSCADFYEEYKEKDYQELQHFDLYLWMLIDQKDYSKAKEIFDESKDDYVSICNVNVLCAMGELALNGYLDLSDTYEKIMNNIHNLYSVGLYKTIVKMDEKLGKDSSSHKKMLKKSIKNSSYLEKKYYKTHDNFLFMI